MWIHSPPAIFLPLSKMSLFKNTISSFGTPASKRDLYKPLVAIRRRSLYSSLDKEFLKHK
jgi:hypothetical protein